MDRQQGSEAQVRQELANALEQAERNRIRVEYLPGEAPMRLGCSKFGGKPHLPEGFRWPRYEGKSWDRTTAERPLSFLCQFDLREAAAQDREKRLPGEGLLSFFYELEAQPWGYVPEHRGGARVYWFPEGTELTETDFPEALEEYCRLPELAIRLEAAPSLPAWDDLDSGAPELARLFGEDEYGRYSELARGMGCWEYSSHLLGWPDLIQNPMGEQCERIARGISCGSGPVPLSPEEQEEIATAAADWVLLFQMGSVDGGDDFELTFGDCGCIYFWIRKQDLAERRFDRVWLILQCG